MKRITLKKISENIEKIMLQKDISAKQLAQISKIGYSSLMPILNGSRDFGVTKLLAISDALECTPDMLLSGLLLPPNTNQRQTENQKRKPKYLAAFISTSSVTYFTIHDLTTLEKKKKMLHFSFGCGQRPDVFTDQIINSIHQLLSTENVTAINNKDIAVFVSTQQFEWAAHRSKIQKLGDNLFLKFIIESDAMTNYRALLRKKNGICITINNGNSISYSQNSGEKINRLFGYGFPISDVAGNLWVGCEAIKHAINVKEGIDKSTLLSDKILALFNDDATHLSECLMIDSEQTYAKASSAVKELLASEAKSKEIVKASTDLLLKRIKTIDDKTKTKLPIALAGELANAYAPFFPQERLITTKDKLSDILLNYGINVLYEIFE